MLALGSLPFLNVLATRFSRRLHPAVMGIQQESAELAAVVEETVRRRAGRQGLRRRTGAGGAPADEADEVYGRSMEAARVRATFLPALELLPNIGLIAALGYGGHQVLNGNLTLGQLVGFNVYVVMLIWPLRMLGMIIAQGQRSAAAAERVHEILDDRPRDRRLPDRAARCRPRGPTAAGARCGSRASASPTRPSCPIVLDGFDLTVPAGQSVALVGATGVGQDHRRPADPALLRRAGRRGARSTASTSATCASGSCARPSASCSRTRSCSPTASPPTSPSPTPTPRPRRSRAPPASRARTSSSTALPEGYDTPIGERGFSLSGGQRQRIAIARAILADPRVLILDDATSSVDPTKEHEIRDALTEVMRGRTTIVIAHRPATIALADRVVLLSDGRVVADGTHAVAPRLQRCLPRGARRGGARRRPRGSD